MITDKKEMLYLVSESLYLMGKGWKVNCIYFRNFNYFCSKYIKEDLIIKNLFHIFPLVFETHMQLGNLKCQSNFNNN